MRRSGDYNHFLCLCVSNYLCVISSILSRSFRCFNRAFEGRNSSILSDLDVKPTFLDLGLSLIYIGLGFYMLKTGGGVHV